MKPISLLLAALVCSSVAAAPAEKPAAKTATKPAEKPAAKTLADLNDLTKLIVPRGELSDQERVVVADVAEAVAARDGAYSPTSQSVLMAAALEKILPSLKGPRPPRTLIELALSLARFGGPDGARLELPFYGSLLGTLGVSPNDAQPRPALSHELAEIGEWATAAVEKLAATLPAEEAARARVRLQLTRGKWAAAETIAREQLKAPKADARWQGYLAAALVLAGKPAAAEPFAAAAVASGGEARNILLDARQLRARLASIDRAAKAFKAQPGAALNDACKKFFTELSASTAKSKSAGDLAIACANVMWQDVYSDWLQRAVEHLPAGSTGGALRAANLLRQLFGQGMPQRPDEAERARLLAQYFVELKPLPLDPADRRLIALLGHLAAASRPIDWRGESDDEKALIGELETRAPCDAAGFALRSVAKRGDRAQLGVFVESVARTCAAAPGGTAGAVDALELLLQLVHEVPPSAPVAAAQVEALAAELARAHPDDPQAITAHADAVALHELASGKPRAIGLEAALSRYEEAIALSTPASGPTARAARESNAAMLALALAHLAAPTSENRRALLSRAANHVRVALAFGEELPTIAVRADLELLSGSGIAATASDLSKQPAARPRARAACMMAREAAARGDGEATRKFLELARAPGPSDEHAFDVAELLPDTAGTFKITLDEKTLRPLVELKTSLYLAPACDPADIKAPPEKAPPAKPANANAANAKSPNANANANANANGPNAQSPNARPQNVRRAPFLPPPSNPRPAPPPPPRAP
ncbi:MAG TPA: hypothetical protein VFF06_22730 [Polyangia bacterium]|nr:hypothetical protein [Polyangia bacterium]